MSDNGAPNFLGDVSALARLKDVLAPHTQPPRHKNPLLVPLMLVSGALIVVTGLLAGVMLRNQTLAFEEPTGPSTRSMQPHSPPERRPLFDPRANTGCNNCLSARRSERSADEMSAGSYAPDGVADEVYFIEIFAPKRIRHIFLNGDGGSHQWDTSIGQDPIPYGPVFGGRPGTTTWHLGVQDIKKQWITDPQTGALQTLSNGHHQLWLYGTGVGSSRAASRWVTVMFDDGTTTSANVYNTRE